MLPAYVPILILGAVALAFSVIALGAEFGRLRSRPGLIAAGLALIGLGVGGGVAARRARRRPRSRLPWRR